MKNKIITIQNENNEERDSELTRSQVIEIINNENTKKSQTSSKSIDYNKNIEERMNILERTYGPVKKPRGQIEKGLTGEIEELKTKVVLNKTELKSLENEVKNINKTIETKIENYLRDETKTRSLQVKFDTVNSINLNTTSSFTAPSLTIDQSRTNITRTLNITGDINIYNGSNKNIQIKNNSSIIADNFNGTCQNATNADKLLDNGIYKSNTELKVKYAEEPDDDNSLLWSQKITNYLNNNKLSNYNQTDSISKGISTLVNGNDLQLRKLKLEEIKNVDGLQEITLISGLSRFKFGNDGIKYSNNNGQNWVNKKLPIYNGLITNKISSNTDKILVDKTIDGKVKTAINLNNFIGSINYFAKTTAPEGWLVCDGQEYDSQNQEYQLLYSVIGYSFGQNGTKFKVPDLRGLFIRGWDNGKNTDPSRIFGTIQQDDNKSHNHTATVESIGNGGLPYAFVGSHGNAKTRYGTTGEGPGAGINTKNEVTIWNNGGTESRPKNMALLPCIRYK